jgi:uncharacterized protein with von Willebrand factor type A (vWA) domain
VIPEISESIEKKDPRIVTKLSILRDGLNTIMEFKDFMEGNEEFFMENIDQLKRNLQNLVDSLQ